MSIEFEPNWQLCEKLSDKPEVHEAYIAFSDDPTQDQATLLAQEIIKAFLESAITRDRYKDAMINGASRWVTVDDSQLNEDGTFKGYMMESIFSEIIVPLLKDEV
jgi:hypothetical protein